MIRSIWRSSHLLLGGLSSLFLIIASVTGVILAVEPVMEEVSYRRSQNNVPLYIVVEQLQNRYDEVLELRVDGAGHAIASISHGDEIDGSFYIDATTGELLGEEKESLYIFNFCRNLHRSLFLKSTGRLLIGIVSFLLIIIGITGIALFVKRQSGWRRIFHRLNKERSPQYFHALLGRNFVIPILLIGATGSYLSLEGFGVVRIESNIEDVTTDSNRGSSLWKGMMLQDIVQLEFPFSDDEEDLFYLITLEEKLGINQYDQSIVELETFNNVQYLKSLSFNIHTGTGSIIWSLILAIASINILYFIYSGFKISIVRLRNRIKNNYSRSEAETVLLYGSENGTSKQFARRLFEQMKDSEITVFIDEMNKYGSFPKMKNLIVVTSTYGDGEAPSNADRFLDRLHGEFRGNKVLFSVLGFGSKAYDHFCKFSYEVERSLMDKTGFEELVPSHHINNKSQPDFCKWANGLGKSLGQEWNLQPEQIKIDKLSSFKIEKVNKVQASGNDYVMMILHPSRSNKFRSGDLIGFYPDIDYIERLYSIGKVDGKIVLSIKKHELGICSNILYNSRAGDIIRGKIIRNHSFHLPKNNKPIIMIGNGTGIAPYIGMIHSRYSQEKYLFWGGRTEDEFALYKKEVETAMSNKTLTNIFIAYSRSAKLPSIYIQSLVKENIGIIREVLERKGSIMICGSIKMRDGVYSIFEDEISKDKLDYFQRKGRILEDCY